MIEVEDPSQIEVLEPPDNATAAATSQAGEMGEAAREN
jgi:hypothetical protein